MSSTLFGTDAFTESQRGVAVLRSVTLDATNLTAQLLATTPNGARVVVTDFVIRDNSFAYTGNTGAAFTLTFNKVTGATSTPYALRYSTAGNTTTEVANGVVTLVAANAASSLPANDGYFRVEATGQAGSASAAAAGNPIEQTGDTLTCTLSYGTGTTPAAGSTIKIDVLGYIL